MKTLKHPQFLIPIIIIIIMLGWIGYQKINVIKLKLAEKQAAEQNIDIEDVDTDADADAVDENTDESLSGDQTNVSDPLTDLADPKTVVSQYIRDHIDEISPKKPVLGGKWFVTKMNFLEGNTVEVEYEDGHIQGKIKAIYTISFFDGQIKISNVEDLMPADTESDKINQTDSETISADNWNSFTHKAYGYTIKFPKDWHWDGTDANVLIISSKSIKSNDENLTSNNLKIIKADQEIIEGILEKNADAEIASLNDNFKAVYLKNHQFKNIIEQIIKSFEI